MNIQKRYKLTKKKKKKDYKYNNIFNVYNNNFFLSRF